MVTTDDAIEVLEIPKELEPQQDRSTTHPYFTTDKGNLSTDTLGIPSTYFNQNRQVNKKLKNYLCVGLHTQIPRVKNYYIDQAITEPEIDTGITHTCNID